MTDKKEAFYVSEYMINHLKEYEQCFLGEYWVQLKKKDEYFAMAVNKHEKNKFLI